MACQDLLDFSRDDVDDVYQPPPASADDERVKRKLVVRPCSAKEHVLVVSDRPNEGCAEEKRRREGNEVVKGEQPARHSNARIPPRTSTVSSTGHRP